MIDSFEEYVKEHCKNVTFEDANAYAAIGEVFLLIIAADQNQNIFDKNTVDITAISTYILWCLIKKSYDSGEPFGKGMFNIAFSDNNKTERLYNLLKSKTVAYKRKSTHYRDRSKVHMGIDNHMKENNNFAPNPWKFKTICFGLCDELDGSKSIFFKPETEGVNFKQDPVGTSKHGLNLVKHIIRPSKIAGTKNYRETGKTRESMQGDAIQKGNEIRFIVDSKSIHLKPLQIASNNLKTTLTFKKNLLCFSNNCTKKHKPPKYAILSINSPPTQLNQKDNPEAIKIIKSVEELFKTINNSKVNDFYRVHSSKGTVKVIKKTSYKRNDEPIVSFTAAEVKNKSQVAVATYDTSNTYEATLIILKVVANMGEKNGMQYRISEPHVTNSDDAKQYLDAVKDYCVSKEGCSSLTLTSEQYAELFKKHDIHIINPSARFINAINDYLTTDKTESNEDNTVRDAFRLYLQNTSDENKHGNQGICKAEKNSSPKSSY